MSRYKETNRDILFLTTGGTHFYLMKLTVTLGKICGSNCNKTVGEKMPERVGKLLLFCTESKIYLTAK